MAKDNQTIPLLQVSESQAEKYKAQAAKCPTKFLYKALKIMNECDVNYRQSSNKRLLVELTLIEVAQITQPDDDNPAAGRGPKRLKSLFKLLASNNQPKPAAQVAGAVKSLSPRASQRQGGAETVAGAETNEPTATTAAPAAATTADKPSATAGKAVKTPKISLGSLGMSFNNLLKEKEKKNVAVQEYEITNKDEETKFSQTDLEREWRAMCVRMEKTAPGQAQRLKNIRPTITDYPNIEIVFDNKIFLDEIKPIQGRLRATMAKYLHNGNIQFSIRLARQEEIKPVLTPLENFERMKTDNPAVKSLVERLGLELA